MSEEERVSVSVSEAPFPEPVLLEQEGAILNGNSFGLHKQQGHQHCLHNHTACKEEECAPLQSEINQLTFPVFRTHQCTTSISQLATHAYSLSCFQLRGPCQTHPESGSKLLSLSACHGISDIVCDDTQKTMFAWLHNMYSCRQKSAYRNGTASTETLE